MAGRPEGNGGSTEEVRRLSGVLAAQPDALTPGPTPLTPLNSCSGPGGCGPTSAPARASQSRPHSTRGGIHWPRVVRPARRPSLPGVPHPSSSSTRASRNATRRRWTPPELLRAASPAPGGKARCGNRGRSISPLKGPEPEEDSPPVPGPSLKPRRSRAHSGGTGGVRMRGSRLSLTLECVPRRTREPRRFP